MFKKALAIVDHRRRRGDVGRRAGIGLGQWCTRTHAPANERHCRTQHRQPRYPSPLRAAAIGGAPAYVAAVPLVPAGILGTAAVTLGAIAASRVVSERHRVRRGYGGHAITTIIATTTIIRLLPGSLRLCGAAVSAAPFFRTFV